jgi:pimeloyl-ACP methyl ester carboxylesterase
MPYLSVEGERQIYFEHHGRSGTAVVLTHGWGMSGRVWDTTVPTLLAAGVDVVTFDQRCCGQSDKVFDDVTIEAFGSDVVRIADHLGLERVLLNGWSLGGAVAVDAAAKLGDRLIGLALTCAATPRFVRGDDWEHGTTPEDLEDRIVALRRDRAVLLHDLAGAICRVDVVGEPVREWLWQIFMQTSHHADYSLRSLGAIDQRAALEAITVPALVVAGALDPRVPRDVAELTAKLLPSASFVELDASSHVPFLEQPEEYRAAIVELVRSCT